MSVGDVPDEIAGSFWIGLQKRRTRKQLRKEGREAQTT